MRAGWFETNFRRKAIASFVLLPSSFWHGRSWRETAVLDGSLMLLMVVESRNTGIETALEPDGLATHDPTRRANDLGSAAMSLSLFPGSRTGLLALRTR